MKNNYLKLVFAGLLALGSITSHAQRIFALTGNTQISVFQASTPATIDRTITVTGLIPSANLVGMDFRPANGQLYALAFSNLIVPAAQLYTIDTASGLASAVGQPILNIDLTGRVAFDFNPTVDRIRVETSNGRNFRLNPNNGALVATDGNLAYAANDVNAGVRPNISSCGYTFSYIASTRTGLYVYDDSLNVFALQAPPNDGILNTIGTSGIEINEMDLTSDMDIWFDESTGSDISYFAGNVGTDNADNLYTINLTTGNVTLVGAIGSNLAVRNIAVAIDRTAPSPVGSLAYAVNSNNFLCSFYTGTPSFIVAAPQITGVSAGYSIEGIDVRPLTGDLYLFAYNRTTDVAKMYTVNTTTGVATQVGNDSIANLGLGSQINFDFNPTVDRIRLSSSNDKNFRLNPITGALVATDGNLKYAMTDVNFGINPNIGAVAYTQSYAGASSTVLYVYDDSLNVFGTQIPPNDGVLNTIGSSGITVDLANQSTDFDIFFDPVTLTNQAFFVANPNASALDNLYTVNLGSGSVTLVDGIGNGIAIRHFSLGIDRTAPTIAGQLVYATTSNNNLISFYTGNPNYIRSQVAVGGIPAGYTLVGTDYRPNGGLLYGLAYNGTTQTAKLYTINEATGAATAVGADSISPIDLSGRVAFDFNPTVDRIRVETSNNKNYRLNPFTGALAATDLDLKFANGDVNVGKDPNVGTGAYINSRAGATTTTLYVFDDSLNVIATQIPPNDGVLNTIGNTGFIQDLMDQTSDMDIYYDPTTMSNLTYMNANVSGSNDNLYSINLSSGAATFINRIGLGIAVRDISVKLDPSSVGIAELGGRKAIQMNVFPNPATDQATLVFSNPQGQSYTLRVMDITGRELLVKNLKGEAGNSNLRLDVNGMPTGIYPIQIELQDGTLFQGKVVK